MVFEKPRADELNLHTFAVISDVHANLEALEAVLSQTRGTRLFCLGDLVDYGASPNEVVERVGRDAYAVVLGNHDQAALTGDTSLFNMKAAISTRWTTKELTVKSKKYLQGLPRELRTKMEGAKAYFAHGSPDDQLWEYVDPSTHSKLFGHYLAKLGVRLVGLGHTHVPYVWREPGGVVFNPGSVGQPRDGDRRASWAVLGVEGDRVDVEIRRVEYDYEAAASKIRGAGLPEFFADRLSSGI